MPKRVYKSRDRSEDGIALLIAIFVLLLISVVAIALLVSSGTETALGANYRSSSTVYYAALAGLEEARGRLLPKNPNYFAASYVPTPYPLNHTLYVINRSPGDNIAPWDQSNQYYDKEYKTEFGVEASSVGFFGSVYSVWDNNVQGIPGPIFKWVRINAVTEKSLYLDVNGNGSWDSPALFFDPAHVDTHGNPWPSLIVPPASPPSTAVQALELTALAYLPNGSHKILQYLVAPLPLDLSPIAPNQAFPAALTLDGVNVVYKGPNNSNFSIVGDDVTTGRTCSTPTLPSVPAIGYTNTTDSSQSNITSGTLTYPANYKGDQPPLPPSPAASISSVSLLGSYQSPAGLDSFTQKIIENADSLIPPGPPPLPPYTAHGSDLPAAMSPTNPMIVVVQGNLDLTGWHNTGYGLLLVTGNLNYDADASWKGIVLVIGQGTVTGSRSGPGQFNGAFFVAQTRDPTTWNLLPGPSLGSASVDFSLTPVLGGTGIRFDSCAISAALTPLTYKVLSFHEIPQ